MPNETAIADNGTAPETQTPPTDNTTAPSDSETSKPAERVIPYDEHQRAMSAQYAQGVKNVLKEAGFDVSGEADAKKQLKAFKAWQDAQKTEAERAAEATAKLQADLSDAQKQKLVLEHRFSAVAKGVPPDRADKLVKYVLANLGDGEEFEATLDAAIAEFPGAKPAIPLAVKPAERQIEAERPAKKIPKII